MNTKETQTKRLTPLQLRALATHLDNAALSCDNLSSKLPDLRTISETCRLVVDDHNTLSKALVLLRSMHSGAQVISKALRDMAEVEAKEIMASKTVR